ncbi:MAG: DNA repair protein RecO [Clostridia bacterium]|nr:DNA repair protein RecO [Clostridia bacterium]
MEDLEVEGLVIRETQMGEADEILTILTADHGKITISGKGVRSMRNRHAASVQLFSYSTLLLHKPKKYYYITDSFFIENFMGIRYDVEKLALATYLCDVAAEFSLEDIADPPLMQLTLNALYAIAYRDDIPLERVKAAYEFRIACEEGFAPEMFFCGICQKEMTETGYLDVMNGRVLCKDCQERYVNSAAYAMDEVTAKIHIRLTPAVLCAMRYVMSAPMKRVLSFQLEKSDGEIFSVACERYLINHLEHSFPSLEYYHALRENRL